MAVHKGHRWTHERPCPICGGYDKMPRGKGVRCWGFLGADGAYAHCCRDELAGGLPVEENSQTYAHRLEGPCKCGQTHGDVPAPPLRVVPPNGLAGVLHRRAWDYEGGLRVVRLDMSDGNKRIWQEHPWSSTCGCDGCLELERRAEAKPGAFSRGRGNVPLTLYCADEIRAAPPSATIYVCEGEKCADAVRDLGGTATTSPMGAKKWALAEHAARPLLEGRDVVVLEDNDPDGRAHADQICASLATTAKSLRRVAFPGDQGRDVVDWIAEGHDGEDLDRLAQQQPDVLEAARARSRAYGLTMRELLSTTEEEDEDDRLDWRVRGFIPEAMPSVVVGEPKVKKTFILDHMAVAVAAGLPRWLGEEPFAMRAGRVLVLALEDHIKTTRRRVRRLAWGLGIDPLEIDNIRIEPNLVPFHFDRREDVDRMRRTLDAWRPCWVVVDSLTKAHSAEENSVKEMSRVTEQWEALCRDYGCAVTAIHHMNKPSATNAKARVGNRMRGSSALFAFVRHVVGVEKEGEDAISVSVDGNMLFRPEPFGVAITDGVSPAGKATVTLTYRGSVGALQADAVRAPVLIQLIEGPQSAGEIGKAIKKRKDTVLACLRSLMEERKVRVEDRKWILT